MTISLEMVATWKEVFVINLSLIHLLLICPSLLISAPYCTSLRVCSSRIFLCLVMDLHEHLYFMNFQLECHFLLLMILTISISQHPTWIFFFLTMFSTLCLKHFFFLFFFKVLPTWEQKWQHGVLEAINACLESTVKHEYLQYHPGKH